LNQKNVAQRLSIIFFDDPESPYSQHVDLELSGKEENVEEMLS
jgi:hypothetical protein